jgi:hypothetical protein
MFTADIVVNCNTVMKIICVKYINMLLDTE